MLPAAREPTADVLESIEQTGWQTMTELRRLRGLLRKSDVEPSLTPQPGLSRLSDLVAEVREAGVGVEVRIDGNLAANPKGLDQSANRIVHELLTNVLKHARAHRVESPLRCRGRCIEIEVMTTGPRPRRPLRAALACPGCANESPSIAGQCRPAPRRRPRRPPGQTAPRRPVPEPITEPGQITRTQIPAGKIG